MKINRRAKRDGKQLFRWCLVNDALDESRVRHIVQHVATTGGRSRLAVLAHFRRLLRLELVRRTAVIESAAPLAPDLQATIETALRSRYGPHLATQMAQRPELIGGMRIQVGCDVYDDSVRARLATLANRL